jgi:hypothetical protein
MADTNSEQSKISIQMYQAYLEDIGRIGSRHENARTFYVSAMSALFVFLAMAGTDGLFENVRGPVLKVVAAVGILVCLSWFEHMRSFGTLFGAKLNTLHKLEDALEKNSPIKPFTEEATVLLNPKKHRNKWSYSPITLVDRFTPLGFLSLFVLLAFLK